MVEHSCDEHALHKHPDWLLDHYIKCGGAVYWATKRKEYEIEVEETEEDYQIWYVSYARAMTGITVMSSSSVLSATTSSLQSLKQD